jgi:hypothetical protein
MKLMSLGKFAIATSTFACTALLSFGWSEQRGVSLSIESAQARIGRPWTPVSVAGVARRQYRRAAWGYGAGVVGAGLGAAAIGTAAVAAASPWGYHGGGPYAAAGWGGGDGFYGGNYYGAGYFANSPWGDYECRNPYGYPCNPYTSKDWWGTGTTAGYVARPYAGVGYYGVGPGYYHRPLARAAYYRATSY